VEFLRDCGDFTGFYVFVRTIKIYEKPNCGSLAGNCGDFAGNCGDFTGNCGDFTG
jgi:hypothetical protein